MIGIFMGCCIYCLFLYILNDRNDRNRRMSQLQSQSPPPGIDENDVVFRGTSGSISPEEMHSILSKRCQYYMQLATEQKELFIRRLEVFISTKTFVIKHGEAFKEMPVLLGAAAIRLTFGLKEYQLPFYKYIRIYPEEYFSGDSFKILAGNVANSTITVAWNHFLQGNSDRHDGSNLGLHEMSHALYMQKIVVDGDFAKDFRKMFDELVVECRDAHKLELKKKRDIYSDYAESDMQEFWAETVELFFEKPSELMANHPFVFDKMKALLNQDPFNMSNPVISRRLTLREKALVFLGNHKTQA